MRSILLICCTIVVLALVFFGYLWFQPSVAERPLGRLGSHQPTSRPQSTTKIAGLGVVESAWILRIDPKTGELASRFRGDRYDPQPGNVVLVDRPEAEFFASDGKQRIRIEGTHGRVVVPGSAAKQKPGDPTGRMEPPSRGQLHDVIISIFEPSDAAEPNVTIRMDNAMFDNDAFRVETESFVDAEGHRVEPDQVPVTLRGTDYDFDGRGLVLLWNERDRKLQLLEIAHGERLVIKNLKMLSKPETGEAQSRLPAPALPDQLASRDRAAVMLIADAPPKRPLTRAQRRRAATRPATQPTSRPRIVRDLTPTFYRATFLDNVRIYEAEKQVGAADLMNVDFLQTSNIPNAPRRE